MPLTLKNVLAVTKQVKKFPALPSIDAVDDAILADTTLPKAEPVTIIEPDIIAEPVTPKFPNNCTLPVISALPLNGKGDATAEPVTTYNVLGSFGDNAT